MNTQFRAPVDLQEESFRNEVGTMDKTGKRKWVFPVSQKENLPTTEIIPAMLCSLYFYTSLSEN